MSAMFSKRNTSKLFESRRGRLDYRAKRDYVRNGVVSIPCRVSDYDDVISAYSVRGNETLNTEFVDYVKSAAEVTPPEYPIVLNVIGECLSQEQKETIEEVIRDDFAYDLGLVEKEEKRHTGIFLFMLVSLGLVGTILALAKGLAEIPRELIFVVFWFAADTLCDYIMLTEHDLRMDRRLAGRLASIKVVFSDSYEDKEYTESDVDKLYSEIAEDVNSTLQE